MEFGYALILSAIIALILLENYGYGYWMISRPVVGGAIVGLLMGDLQTGLIVGGSVELMYMGVLPIGGSIPPNAHVAGMISTVFAISSGGNAEIGIALALPIGILAQFLTMLIWNINIFLMHLADKEIAEGNVRKVELIHMSGLITFFLAYFAATFLAVYFGSDFVQRVVDNIPNWLNLGLTVASGILPAVGMAMLLKMMNFKKYWPFFMLGFAISSYLGLDVLPLSIIAFGIVAAMNVLRNDRKATNTDDEFDNEWVEETQEIVEQPEFAIKLNNKDIRKLWLRTYFSMTSINYERYSSLGFCYALIPALKKLYPDDDEFKQALLRNNEFFNCHPYTTNAVVGVTIALEEQKANGMPVTADAIRATKTALMGPLSGIGDSVFKAIFMTMFAALGAGMAINGNPLGPIVFLVPMLLMNTVLRYYFTKEGHRMGTDIVSKMSESDALDNFVETATIVGMMVIGPMIISFVKFAPTYTFTFSGTEQTITDMLNPLLPAMLPLIVTLVFYRILIKYNKGMYACILLSFALGIFGVMIGAF